MRQNRQTALANTQQMPRFPGLFEKRIHVFDDLPGKLDIILGNCLLRPLDVESVLGGFGTKHLGAELGVVVNQHDDKSDHRQQSKNNEGCRGWPVTWNPDMVQETAGRRCVETAVVDLLGPRSGVSMAADNVGNKADLGRSTRGLVPATSWVVGVGATVHFARVAGNGPIWWPRCGWPTGRNAEGARTAWARHAAGSGE